MTLEYLCDLARANGFDPCPLTLQRVPGRVLHTYASDLAPNRFAHWIFGRDRQRLATTPRPWWYVVYHQPLHLLVDDEANPLQTAIAMARGMGHADVVHYNHWLPHLPVDPLCWFRRHSEQIQAFEEMYGQAQVADLIRHGWCLRDYPDILAALTYHGTQLAHWEFVVLSILEQECRYLQALARVRVVNDGWATLCQIALARAVPWSAHDAIEIARYTAQQLGRRSPATLGYRMFADVIANQGMVEAQAMRARYDDVTLVRNHLSDALIREFYSTPSGGEADQRDRIVENMAELGLPRLELAVEDDALKIHHAYGGREINLPELKMVLSSLQALWRQPVIFSTVLNDQRISLRYAPGKLVETTYH